MRAQMYVYRRAQAGYKLIFLCAWEVDGGGVECGRFEHASSSKAAASLSQAKV